MDLGYFSTAEEEALCCARTPEAQAAAAAPPDPPPMTAVEALRQAEAEGLTLLRSESSSGYRGVHIVRFKKSKPYLARVSRGGMLVSLGNFTTAEEAALCVARSPEGQAAAAAPPEPPPLTAEEAVRQAEVEGLTMLRSERSCTGYLNVAFNINRKSKPYLAQVSRGGQDVYLGTFATPEEAALHVARTPEAQAAAAAPPEPPPMTAEAAVMQAELEGLTLLRSEGCRTGYKGVHIESCRNLTKPYVAQAKRGGKKVTIGYFATPEEAALHVARASAAQVASPQPPATSSRKRKVKSEEQPPDMPADDEVVILDGQFVDGVSMPSVEVTVFT